MKCKYLNLKLLSIVWLIWTNCFIAHSQGILWEKSYGGKNAEYLFDAEPTADYGFILAGSSLSNKTGNKTDNNNGDLDYWVWKMDEKGELDWQKSFGGSGFDLLQSIKNTRDGGFILAGSSSSNNGFQKKDTCRGVTDFWIIKLDAKGEEQWQKTIGGNGQDDLLCVFQTIDGGYMLGGSSSSNPVIIENDNFNKKKNLNIIPDLYAKSEKSRGNMDYWIVKLDKTGEVQWQKTYGGEYADLLRSMEQTKDGGYILGGYSNSSISGDRTDAIHGIGDFWILKVSSIGDIEWQRAYGGSGDNQLYVIHQTDNNGYMVGGNSNSTTPLTAKGGMVSNGTDYWVLQLDETGNVLWSETYDFGKVDILTSLVENKDHTFLIGGYSTPSHSEEVVGKIRKDKNGINDYIALKISDTGEQLWSTTVGSGGEDILRKLIETRDGGYVLAGTSDGSASKDKNGSLGSNDFWVVKLKDKKKPLEVKAGIEAIPNPAVSFTNIIIGYEFESGTATVVDLAGRTLQKFDINSRTVPIDLSRYPDEIYVVNIKTNIQQDGVKVVKKGGN